jgi:hypothetical protein
MFFGEYVRTLQRAHSNSELHATALNKHFRPQNRVCTEHAEGVTFTGTLHGLLPAFRQLQDVGPHWSSAADAVENTIHVHHSPRVGTPPTPKEIASLCTLAMPEYTALKIAVNPLCTPG